MKLTKKKALQICAELWRWLEAHPSMTGKARWPGWRKYGHMESYCPCCEYGGCSKCPMLGLWPHLCLQVETPYVRWRNAKTPKTRKKYAGIIAAYAEGLLK